MDKLTIYKQDEKEVDENEEIPVLIYTYGEVRYGELPFFEKLERAGIPYSSSHEQGHDFEGEIRHVRFTDDGEIVRTVVFDVSSYNIPVADLLSVIDDHEALKVMIRAVDLQSVVLPWINQEVNRKTYLMKQIIAPE